MTTSILTPPRRGSAADDYVPFDNVGARNDLQALIEVPILCKTLRLPRGVRVLEVGCGRGVALPILSERLVPKSLTGIDIDAELARIARNRNAASKAQARVVEGDVRKMPFDDASFDLVIDFGTCYHVSGGVSGSLRALREIARVLAPEGIFVHETPAAQHLAHPVRSFGRSLPWNDVPTLHFERTAVLWSRRRRIAA
jgi:SAM-dependent methyltransferase